MARTRRSALTKRDIKPSKKRRVWHSSASNGGRDDWRTPPKVLNALRAGWEIGLDPCASSHVAYHLAAVNLDVARDGLSMPWATLVRGTGGAVFVNWPYSASAAWAAKVLAEAAAGAPIIVLCAARPGALWYRSLKAAADAVAEVHGRLNFLSGDEPVPRIRPVVEDAAPFALFPDGLPDYVDKPTDSAPFPSAILGFNVSWRRFFAAFSHIATCEVPR